MKKFFFMQSRRSGKTTKAIYEFSKDPENTLFVTHSFDSAKLIKDSVNSVNVISASQLKNNTLGYRPKNIILDEYMFFENKAEIYDIVNNYIQPENLYVFSTSDKIYNLEIFNFVKNNKQKMTFHDMLLNYPRLTKDITKQIHELYHNFLTDSDVKVIENNKSFDKEKVDNVYQIVSMGFENYGIQFLNSYLK